MRRNPLVLIGVLASFVLYTAIREVGHLISGLLLGLRMIPVLRYGFLPGFEVKPHAFELTPKEESLIIISGPTAALLAGYVLLCLIARWHRQARSPLRMLLAVTCYLALVLDPIYYCIIPLARLGGEPERLATLLDIPTFAVEISALGLLVLNTVLTRKRLVPFLRGV